MVDLAARVGASRAPALALVLALIACGDGVDRAAEARAEAEAVWATRCVNCHGPAGLGDGPAGRALFPPPRSFADAAWQASTTDGRIRRAILYGGASLELNPAMAPNPDLRGRSRVTDELVRIVRGFARGGGADGGAGGPVVGAPTPGAAAPASDVGS